MKSPAFARVSRSVFVCVLSVAISVATAALAATPQTINYQGVLSSAGAPVTGTRSVTFKLYAASTGGTALWSETQSLAIANGLFSTQLGLVTPFASVPLAFDAPYFLGITVDTDAEMTPRPPLTSVPYSLRSVTAESLSVLSVIANGGNVTLVGGALGNAAQTAASSTIGGGGGAGTVPGPETGLLYGPNTISGDAHAAVIGGGTANQIVHNGNAVPVFATISGGSANSNYAYFGTVAGGRFNTAGQSAVGVYGSVVSGGFGNNAYDSYATISGGGSNQAGYYGTVPGGDSNRAAGEFSFAAGRGANSAPDGSGARHYGTFVWADSNDNAFGVPQTFFSTNNDQFAVRARGGIVFRVASTTDAATGPGCSLPAGGAASWSCSSDRNMKDRIIDIAPQDILAKVAALPVTSWSFKGTDRRHIGPMAQDFRALFGLGVDDKNITTSDVSGVALAAIQGLYQLLQERDGEIARLKSHETSTESELAKMKRELGEIKALLGLRR